jgi:hypothetical protein
MNLSFSIDCTSLDEFIEHWSKRYPDPGKDEIYYEPYVGKPLTKVTLMKLFKWKNGSVLAPLKRRSVEINYPTPGSSEQLEQRYLSDRANGGAIWNIFYAHCVDPKAWPIFDQHTFRAMRFMQTGIIEGLPLQKRAIYQIYKTEFIPFVDILNGERRKVDRALFAFGQFLKKVAPYR